MGVVGTPCLISSITIFDLNTIDYKDFIEVIANKLLVVKHLLIVIITIIMVKVI